MNNNNLGGIMSFSMHKRNILKIDRAVKIERVGLRYKLYDTDMIGTQDKDMSIAEHADFFKKNGIKLPMIRRDTDMFFLEVEYGTDGFYVLIPVNEEVYEEEVNKFFEGYSVR
jgi:hypothetical protein